MLSVLFFSMKKSTAQERRHTPIDSVILYSRQKKSDIHIYAKEGIFIVEYHFINVFSIFTGQ